MTQGTRRKWRSQKILPRRENLAGILAQERAPRGRRQFIVIRTTMQMRLSFRAGKNRCSYTSPGDLRLDTSPQELGANRSPTPPSLFFSLVGLARWPGELGGLLQAKRVPQVWAAEPSFCALLGMAGNQRALLEWRKSLPGSLHFSASRPLL